MHKMVNISCSHMYMGAKVFDHMEVESEEMDKRW